MQANDLIGSWELTAWETRLDDQVLRPLGDRPRGLLLYTVDGWMAVQIILPDRARIATVDPLGGSEQERAAAYAGCLAYCGQYEPRGGQVVHQIELSSFPNWVGDKQVRFLELDNDELVLRTPPIQSPDGVVVSELRWARQQRAKRDSTREMDRCQRSRAWKWTRSARAVRAASLALAAVLIGVGARAAHRHRR
jgi:hypothetical protein